MELRAGGDAFVYSVGSFGGNVSAADYAGAVALGGFDGSLAASGADGFITSEGDVNASMTTGRDLGVWALGSVDGSYHAGRDAAVLTYDDFNAALAADRDVGRNHFDGYGVPGVWAAGSIYGTISAGRNIGHWDQYYDYVYGTSRDYDLFAFGEIDALIEAANASGSSLGGRIGGVGAIGPIAGQISAAHSVGTVHSGAEITDAVFAPSIGQLIELDGAMATVYPPPLLPGSCAADLKAEADAIHTRVLLTKAGVYAAKGLIWLDLTFHKTLEAVTIAIDKAVAVWSNAETAQKAQALVDAAVADFEDVLEELHQNAVDILVAVDESADLAESDLATERDRVAKLAIKAHEKALTAKTQVEAGMQSTADPMMAKTKKVTFARSQGDRRIREAVWKAYSKAWRDGAFSEEFHLPDSAFSRMKLVLPDVLDLFDTPWDFNQITRKAYEYFARVIESGESINPPLDPGGTQPALLAICHNKSDWPTSLASKWWWWKADAHVEVDVHHSRGGKSPIKFRDWTTLRREIEDKLDRGNYYIQEVTFVGHGNPGDIAWINLHSAQMPGTAEYKFFQFLASRMRAGGVIHVRSCDAVRQEHIPLFQELAKSTQATVIAYDDWICGWGTGNVYFFFPDGRWYTEDTGWYSEETDDPTVRVPKRN